MKIPFQKIKKDFTFTTLSQPEKRVILKSINLYMAENPVIKQRFSFNLLITKNYMIPTIIIALLLATSGGTVMAAENSLPGDMLYNVKLSVNERMMTAMAVSDDAEADVQAKLMERRLQEYNKLLEKNKWSAEKEQQMTARLNRYQAKTLALIERLRSSGQSELAMDIYNRMMAKANSYEEFVAMVKASSNGDSANQLPERMKEMRQKMLDKDVSDVPEGAKVSAESHIKNAIEAIEKLSEVIEAQEATLNERLQTYLSNSLAEARTYLSQAQDSLAAGSYREASDLAKRSMQVALKARNFNNMIENADTLMSDKRLDKITELKSWTDGWQVRAENMFAQAERYAEKLKAELANKENNLSAEMLKEARAKIAEAELLITRARQELSAANYEASSEASKSAFNKLMEVRITSNEVVATDWRGRAENAIAKAGTLIERVKLELGTQTANTSQSFIDRLRVKINEAEVTLTRAKTAYSESKFEEAYGWARKAIEQISGVRPVEMMKEMAEKARENLKSADEQKREEVKEETESLSEDADKAGEIIRNESQNRRGSESEDEVED